MASLNLLKKAEGETGQIEVYADRVILKRQGAWATFTTGFAGDKTIFIKQISGIEVRNAGGFIRGHIKILFLGGQDASNNIFSDNFEPSQNTIYFNINQQKSFEEIKALIEKLIAETDNSGSKVSGIGINDLEKLAELKQKGIITEEEFNIKKKQILGI